MYQLLHTIILLGALQGTITGGLLFFTGRTHPPNRLLALLIWSIALASFNLYVDYTGWFYTNTTTAVIHAILPTVILMPVGPLLYFYVRSSLEAGFELTKKHRIHFLPVIIDLVPSLTTMLFFTGVMMGWMQPDQAKWGRFIDQWNVYADIPRWLSITVYTVFALRYYSRLRHTTMARPDMYQWMKLFIRVFLIFQVLWLIYLVPYVIPRYTDRVLNAVGWYPVYIPLAVMIYWLGIKGYALHLKAAAVKRKAAGNSSLTMATVLATVASLERSMQEDGIYLDPDLSLQLLAQHTGIAQKTISTVLNQHMNVSFNEYVNQYRIEAFKKKLQQPGMDHLTIAGIAQECGFNSKATFQRIFREQTGSSPSEFRKSLEQNGQ